MGCDRTRGRQQHSAKRRGCGVPAAARSMAVRWRRSSVARYREQRSAADGAGAHGTRVLGQQVGAKGAAVGRDGCQQRLPRIGALALGHRHRGQRGARGVGRVERIDAELRDRAVRDRAHFEVAAVVSEGEARRRKLVHLSHHARSHNRVRHVRLGRPEQVLALVIPRLGHRAEAVDQDRWHRPRRLALAGDPHDPLARAARPGRIDQIGDALVVDLLAVRRLARRVAPQVAQLARPPRAVHREARRAAVEERGERGTVGDVALDERDARHRCKPRGDRRRRRVARAARRDLRVEVVAQQRADGVAAVDKRHDAEAAEAAGGAGDGDDLGRGCDGCGQQRGEEEVHAARCCAMSSSARQPPANLEALVEMGRASEGVAAQAVRGAAQA
eukprot:1309844-Prymnesium_polylepis.1